MAKKQVKLKMESGTFHCMDCDKKLSFIISEKEKEVLIVCPKCKCYNYIQRED